MNILKPKFWDKNQISFFAILLFPLTILIRFLNFIKNLFIKKIKFSIPIICVGNIYLGGTGKTPFSIELYSILKKLNKNSAFIRKKYKNYQDEINSLKKIGKVYESTKRSTALNNAIEDNVDVAILDDGFQDFSIEKNLTIICFSEPQWIGNGLTIPSGPLRENLSSLNRADFVIINGKKNINIENKILKHNKFLKIFYTRHEPQNIGNFKNKTIISFAGIGNPCNFFKLLNENGVKSLEEISFPDHYNYKKEDLINLINKAEGKNAILLTTEKDYLRIDDNYKNNIKYLEIKTKLENEFYFIEEVKKFI